MDIAIRSVARFISTTHRVGPKTKLRETRKMKRETQIVKVQAGGWLATGDKYSVSGENQVKLGTMWWWWYGRQVSRASAIYLQRWRNC